MVAFIVSCFIGKEDFEYAYGVARIKGIVESVKRRRIELNISTYKLYISILYKVLI